MMQLGMDFEWLLDRFLIDLGSQDGSPNQPKIDQKVERKSVLKTQPKNNEIISYRNCEPCGPRAGSSLKRDQKTRNQDPRNQEPGSQRPAMTLEHSTGAWGHSGGLLFFMFISTFIFLYFYMCEYHIIISSRFVFLDVYNIICKCF